jgi:hypothetical protein
LPKTLDGDKDVFAEEGDELVTTVGTVLALVVDVPGCGHMLCLNNNNKA